MQYNEFTIGYSGKINTGITKINKWCDKLSNGNFEDFTLKHF